MVLTITMLIFMLVAIVLSVTTVSRRLTARYSYYIGLYDLAVSGNEQALFLLLQSLEAQKDAIIYRSWEQVIEEELVGFVYYEGGLRLDSDASGYFRQFFIAEAMNELNAAWDGMFPHVRLKHRQIRGFVWNLNASIGTDVLTTEDSYRAITALTPAAANFTVRTRIYRYTGGYPGIPATVRASIIWSDSGYSVIVLDAYTIDALESDGVVFPVAPILGENLILFLDEFTLSMVESLRIVCVWRDHRCIC